MALQQGIELEQATGVTGRTGTGLLKARSTIPLDGKAQCPRENITDYHNTRPFT